MYRGWRRQASSVLTWAMRFSPSGSVFSSRERFDSLARQGIPRLDVQRFLKGFHRGTVHLLAQIGAAQIVVREMARLVAAGLYRLLQPGNGFIVAGKFDEIGPDVVVGIAEVRIELDGALAFGDGFFDAALKMIGPAEEGMRLGGGMQLERSLIELYRALVVAFHLRLIRVLQNFPCTRQGILIHGTIN